MSIYPELCKYLIYLNNITRTNMLFPPYNPSDPLQTRKPLLDSILQDLKNTYQLSTEDLARYIIPTSLVPDDLQVDLLIHALDLYQKVLSKAEILHLVESTIDSSLLLDYQNGNTKALNKIIGIMVSKYKNLSPKAVSQALKD